MPNPTEQIDLIPLPISLQKLVELLDKYRKKWGPDIFMTQTAEGHLRLFRPCSGCLWTPNEDGNWETGCGNTHVLMNGTPAENQHRFCPYCGKPIQQAL